MANYNEPWNKGATKEQFPQLSGHGRCKGCIPWNKGIHQWEGKVHPMLGKANHKASISMKLYWETHPEKHSKVVIDICKFCGIEFPHLKSDDREYCSRGCAASNHSIESRKIVGDKARNTNFRNGNYQRHSERMKNGGALKALHGNFSISIPQLKLFIIMKRLFPEAILEYPVNGRSLDVAIPSVKLDIEYDGKYWHLDRPNAKEIDQKRDMELSALGWKVIRFNKDSFGGVLCR